MKTYLRRWWLVNRLYHFTRVIGNKFVDKNLFVRWMVGEEISTIPDVWYSPPPTYNLIHKLGTKFLMGKKKRALEIDRLIEECANDQVAWVSKPQDFVFKDPLTSQEVTIPSNNIAVSVAGLEVYAVSNLVGLFFGNGWVRTIGTGITIALIVWYVTDRVKEVVPTQPTKIQVEYIQPGLK